MKKIKDIDLALPAPEKVGIYYPDGELIVETDNIELMNYVRCQIYENDICGCYAESGGRRAEINGRNNWPFNGENLKILAKLVIEKGKFMERHPELD